MVPFKSEYLIQINNWVDKRFELNGNFEFFNQFSEQAQAEFDSKVPALQVLTQSICAVSARAAVTYGVHSKIRLGFLACIYLQTEVLSEWYVENILGALSEEVHSQYVYRDAFAQACYTFLVDQCPALLRLLEFIHSRSEDLYCGVIMGITMLYYAEQELAENKKEIPEKLKPNLFTWLKSQKGCTRH